jgi:ADP-ribosylglycohydrolase
MGINTELRRMEAAIGPAALLSLRERGLLPTTPGPSTGRPARVELARGALLGLAIGAASGLAGDSTAGAPIAAAGARTPHALAAGLTLEISHGQGWAAPAAVSDAFVARRRQLRGMGRAIPAAIQRRRDGLPWFEAGVGSFGNAALPRAVALGLLFAAEPDRRRLAAAADAAVTHASRLATAAAVAVADLAAGLAARPDGTGPSQVVAELRMSITEPELLAAVDQAIALVGRPADVVIPRLVDEATAAGTLAIAVWSVLSNPDPGAALRDAMLAAPHADTVAAIVGAMAGAVAGETAVAGLLPSAWAALARYRDVVDAVFPVPSPAPGIASKPIGEPGAAGQADIWLLLDRSGSMRPLRSDVVGGVAAFVDEQRRRPGDARISIAQFDGEEPFDLMVDRASLAEVPDLAPQYQPRGLTPLYDAIGRLLDRAESLPADDADRLIVIFTDGHENNSSRWTAEAVRERITGLQARGWTFVFLGANIDSYDTGSRVGLGAGNVTNYAGDSAGTAVAYQSLTRAAGEWRGKSRAHRVADRDAFWGRRKEAEDDLRGRGGR